MATVPIQVENICPDFLAFWERARGHNPDDQRRLWRVLYEQRHREIFDVYYGRYGSPELLEAALHRYALVVPRILALVPDAERLASETTPRCAALFAAPSADFAWVLMVGLFASDAWAAPLRGRTAAFLALESPTLAERRSIAITVAHEAAHAVHEACAAFSLADSTLVGLGLFAEGVAVLASMLLVPGESEHAYLCPGAETTQDGQDCRAWLADCDERWPELRRRLLRDVDQDDPARFATYFWGGRHRRGDAAPTVVPVRAGYVVGYRVVGALNRHYTLPEMARWSPEQAAGAVRATLEATPHCPAHTPARP